MAKYSDSLMEAVRQNLGVDEDDTSRDVDIEAMDKREVLDRALTWEGIIGYTDKLINWFKSVYGELPARVYLDVRDKDKDVNIVLCYLPNSPQKYVTWTQNKQDGSTFWGHYFSDPEAASKDFKTR